MTPTQFDALKTSIDDSIAASREALAKIDLLLARLTASEPIEPFNAAQDAPEAVEASEVPETTIPPCGWPPEPAPEGMRWRYAGNGIANSSPISGQGPTIKSPFAYCWPNGSWNFDFDQFGIACMNGGADMHYFTAEPIQL